MPLGIAIAIATEFGGSNAIQVTFDAPARCTGFPNWSPFAGAFDGIAALSPPPCLDFMLMFGAAPPPDFTVPVGAVGFESLTGGAVVPGLYPVV